MKNIWKWIIVVVGLLIVALCIAGWYYSRNWQSMVKTKLDERLAASSDSLYRLTYDDMTLNLTSGSLVLRNAALVSDSVVYRKLVRMEKAPDNRFDIKLATLKVSGLNIWSALLSKRLTIDHILLDTVDFRVIVEPHPFNQGGATAGGSLYDKVKDVFRAIHVQGSTIEKLDLTFSKIEKGVSNATKIDQVRIDIRDFLLDEHSMHDSTRFFYTKEIKLEVPRFEYDVPNSVYKIAFERLVVDSKRQNAVFTKVALHPRVSKQAYFEGDKQNKAMIVLAWDTLRLEKVDFADMADRQRVFARYAYIKNGSASFHKDKRYQEDNVNKIGQAPHQQVMKLGQRIRFDTVFVENTDVSYHEYSAKYHRIGSITFEGARGSITNLTNDSVRLAKNRYMRADLRARLMGSGALHAQFGFDMLSEAGSHSYKGTLGAMQARAFNRILTPLLNFEFASGNIRGIRFDMQGTDYKNWGEFRFDYDDMSVSLLHAPKEGSRKKKKGVLSFLANELLIKDSNPDADGVYRIGKVEHTRVPEYSHFKTLWKSIQEGIQQCVGISKAATHDLSKDEEQDPAKHDQPKGFLEKTGDFFKGLFGEKDG